MATNPDLPSPITPDGPSNPGPADMPVEPDQGVSCVALSLRAGTNLGTVRALHLRAHVPRQFMRVVTYRWPRARLLSP